MSSLKNLLFIIEAIICDHPESGRVVTFKKVVTGKRVVTFTVEAVSKICSEISKNKNLKKRKIKTKSGVVLITREDEVYTITPQKRHDGKNFFPKDRDNQWCTLNFCLSQILYLRDFIEDFEHEEGTVENILLNPKQKH